MDEKSLAELMTGKSLLITMTCYRNGRKYESAILFDSKRDIENTFETVAVKMKESYNRLMEKAG